MRIIHLAAVEFVPNDAKVVAECYESDHGGGGEERDPSHRSTARRPEINNVGDGGEDPGDSLPRTKCYQNTFTQM